MCSRIFRRLSGNCNCLYQNSSLAHKEKCKCHDFRVVAVYQTLSRSSACNLCEITAASLILMQINNLDQVIALGVQYRINLVFFTVLSGVAFQNKNIRPTKFHFGFDLKETFMAEAIAADRTQDREIRMRFMRIDARTGELLCEFWKVVEPALPNTCMECARLVSSTTRSDWSRDGISADTILCWASSHLSLFVNTVGNQLISRLCSRR